MTTVAAHGRADHGIRTPLMAAGLSAVVAAIVLGILGMHGLAHNPMQMTGASHSATVGVSVEATGHSMATRLIDPLSASARGGTVAEVPVPAHSMGEMVMLCAAMLVAVAAGILLALRLRRCAPRIPVSLRPRPGNRTFPFTARIGIGPPVAWKFSVIRC
ncbi:hypothetical protein G7072_08560 [Nocardioides sp. HDW12B]|uniref:DUF6153 family protein n=1 Tax=Nocardioides sp. HDW12B TaxID=2714939 RepID=UPI0014089A48|nr:DUF6153 family protein [Nocardioides sp. HDW12B]QIK66402.1 hypothetical protein G7072_08560 [Nocardioides sp. HDW12B]